MTLRDRAGDPPGRRQAAGDAPRAPRSDEAMSPPLDSQEFTDRAGDRPLRLLAAPDFLD